MITVFKNTFVRLFGKHQLSLVLVLLIPVKTHMLLVDTGNVSPTFLEISNFTFFLFSDGNKKGKRRSEEYVGRLGKNNSPELPPWVGGTSVEPVPAPKPTGGNNSRYSSAQQVGLNSHNQYRRRHQDTPMMELDPKMCSDAQVLQLEKNFRPFRNFDILAICRKNGQKWKISA